MCVRVSVYLCARVCVLKSVAICEHVSVNSVSGESLVPEVHWLGLSAVTHLGICCIYEPSGIGPS